MYLEKSEEFWNSEVGRAAIEGYREETVPNQEMERGEEEEEKHSGEGAAMQHAAMPP
jgi:hypothetical protein